MNTASCTIIYFKEAAMFELGFKSDWAKQAFKPATHF